MKKKLCLLLAVMVCLTVLSGCGCEHEWIQAGCTTTKTCAKCQEVEGAALGHIWTEATCTAPKTCGRCGETQGKMLAHQWKDADCVNPMTCPDCGAAEGQALGHSWVEATYETPKTCSVCAVTEGEPLELVSLGVDWEEFEELLSTALEGESLKLAYDGLDGDDWPTYKVTDDKNKEQQVTVAFEPAEDGKALECIMIAAVSSDEDAVYQMGVITGVALVTLDKDFDVTVLQTLVAQEPTVEGTSVVYSLENSGFLIQMSISMDYAVFWITPAE